MSTDTDKCEIENCSADNCNIDNCVVKEKQYKPVLTDWSEVFSGNLYECKTFIDLEKAKADRNSQFIVYDENGAAANVNRCTLPPR